MRVGLRRKSGFSLIEVLISMGLVSILALVVFGLNNFMNRGKVTSNVAFAADSFRKEIVALLLNPVAWRQTLLNNATFNCVTSAGDCTTAISNGPPANDYSYATLANSAGPCVGTACKGGFDVYTASPSATVFYPFVQDSNAGFKITGAQCGGTSGWIGVASGKTSVGTKTSGTTNSSRCPFRLVLWWVPVCPSVGQCKNPAVRVRGYTLYTPATNETSGLAAFNPANYGIDIVLQPRYQ